MIFETHAHYDDEAFQEDREILLRSMEGHGIGRIINVCASLDSLTSTERLMETYPLSMEHLVCIRMRWGI